MHRPGNGPVPVFLRVVAHKGLGIALAPRTVAEARLSELAVVPLGVAELCWELVIAYLPQGCAMTDMLDAAPNAFLQMLGAQGLSV